MYGQRIKELRIERKLTQEELADILNISRSFLSKIESGASVPGIDTIICCCEYFGVSLDYIVGNTNCRSLESNPALKKIKEMYDNPVQTEIINTTLDLLKLNDDKLDYLNTVLKGLKKFL